MLFNCMAEMVHQLTLKNILRNEQGKNIDRFTLVSALLKFQSFLDLIVKQLPRHLDFLISALSQTMYH